MNKAQSKSYDPPFSVAWGQALASIRVRFWRHSLTTAGIALSAAFFASMLTLRAAEAIEGHLDSASSSRLEWLAGTSLVMCLVGVTNSMLMSVTERFREIGTIKCIGASNGFIVKVFFLEAALLGAIGSITGAFAGVALMSIGVLAMGYAAPWQSVGFVFAISVAIGVGLTVFSAILPAIQAAKMPAVNALRTEI
jgi:putative ABC transport system permease protein